MIRATLEAAQPGWLLGTCGCRCCVAHELGFCLGELQGRRIDYGLGFPVAQPRRDFEVPPLGGDPWGLGMSGVVDRNVAMAVMHKPPSAVDPDLCWQHARRRWIWTRLGQQPANHRVASGAMRTRAGVWPLDAVQVELEPVPSGRLV